MNFIKDKAYLYDGEILIFKQPENKGIDLLFEGIDGESKLIAVEEAHHLGIHLIQDHSIVYQCKDCKKIMDIYQVDDSDGFCPYCGFYKVEKYS